MISSIGICDVSGQVTARWEFEMGQINLPWDYNAFPEVEVVPVENLFDCDVFVFVASRGIPPVGSQVKDVRMAQFETNAAIVKQYAKMARAPTSRVCGAPYLTRWTPWPRPPIWRATRTKTACLTAKACAPNRFRALAWG